MKKIILSLMICAVGMSAWAYDQAVQNQVYYGQGFCAYGLSDGTVGIYDLYGKSGEVTIPATIQIWTTEEPYTMTAEYEVSALGIDGWSTSTNGFGNVTKLILSEGIETIAANAFTTWAQTTTLEEIVLPSTLTSIGNYAFYYCDGLTKITSYSNDVTCGTDAFKGSTSWDHIAANCKLIVPDGAVLNYAKYTGDNTKTWSYFDQFYTAHNIKEATWLTMTSVGYTTYYNQYGWVMPAGLEGYVINGSGLVKVYDEGDEVCPEIALLIKSTSAVSETQYYEIDALASGGNTATWPRTDDAGNIDPNGDGWLSSFLNGTQTKKTFEAYEGNYYYYKLAKGANGLGWYWGAEDGGVFENGAHKAYMAMAQTAASAQARQFIPLVADQATAIENTEAAKAEKVMIDGQIFIIRDGIMYDVMGKIVK